jgi:hypothetical protein
MNRHYQYKHKSNNFDVSKYGYEIKQSAFKNDMSILSKKPKKNEYDYDSFFKSNHKKLKQLLKMISLSMLFRFQLCLFVIFEKPKVSLIRKVPKVVYENIDAFFCSKMHLIMNKKNISKVLKSAYRKISKCIDEFISHGSGWSIKKIKRIDIKLLKYYPLSGGCHTKDLPSSIVNKKATISFKTNDNKCFLWCVIASIYPSKKNKHIIASYSRLIGKFDCSMLEYPTSLKQISKFEKVNKLRINIFSLNKNGIDISPLQISDKKNKKEINILYFDNHFFLIQNINRLLGHKGGGLKFYCFSCCQGFRCKQVLKTHKRLCEKNEPKKIVLPSLQKNILEFNDFSKLLRAPYVCYYDFESILEKQDTNLHITKDNAAYQNNIHKHIPCSYAMVIVDYVGNIIFRKLKRTLNPALSLLKTLQKQASILLGNNSLPCEKIKMNKKDIKNFKRSKSCYVCKKIFADKSDKVRDHDHFDLGLINNSNYRGAACISCNAFLRYKKKLPCIAHSSRSYDSHFLILTLDKIDFKSINIIPQNMEKYTAIVLDNLIFLDSYLFLSAPLSVLVKNLKTENLICSRSVFNKTEQFHLLTQKGFFPYEYLDSFSKFKSKDIPTKNDFQNTLTQSSISSDDYNFVKKVWSAFECKDFGDYHDIYLMTDCLLLADVFENFRNVSFKNFQIEPVHFFTLPMFSWTAALKFTKIKLELLTDYDMVLFFESGIRGGISVASHRHAKANNKYLPDFDKNKPSSFISYLDCNSLYSTIMCEPLPTNEFTWLSSKEINTFNIMECDDYSNIGYVLEVDIEYSKELHDLHNDYPVCAEHFKVLGNMLSPIQKQFLETFKNENIEKYKSYKLVPNLYDKTCYIIHYRNLKLVLQLGLKLKKIHRILRFKQSPWLAPYIDFNISKRKEAKDDFSKDFFKLLNNSVFGKTMENQRKRIAVKVVTSAGQMTKLAKKPNLESFSIISENLVLCKIGKTTLQLNKPIYIGFCVLDLSKVLMTNFYYNVLKKVFPVPQQMNLLYTDTDSFIIKVMTDDLFEDFKKIDKLMDFSDYPSNHFLYSNENKKVNGKFKDETKSVLIEEFIALKSKMYIARLITGKDKLAAKGVKTHVINNDLKAVMYTESLNLGKVFYNKQYQIVSKKHQIFTKEIQKLTLSGFDDKRYICKDNISTLAFGNYNLCR